MEWPLRPCCQPIECECIAHSCRMESFRSKKKSIATGSGAIGEALVRGKFAFRGVTKENGKFRAFIGVGGVGNASLGTFVDEEEAARAYDSAAFHLHKGWVNCLGLLPGSPVNLLHTLLTHLDPKSQGCKAQLSAPGSPASCRALCRHPVQAPAHSQEGWPQNQQQASLLLTPGSATTQGYRHGISVH